MGLLSAFQKRPLTDPLHSVEKFSGLIARFLQDNLRAGVPNAAAITLIARSPLMAACRALTLHADEIVRQQIAVRIVFAKLAPIDQLAQLSGALKLVNPRNTAAGSIRFIRNGALLDAHEQLVLANAICWTGDMLRRSDENRNGLDIVEEGMPGPVRLAELSFNAIWAVARPLPGRALSGHPLAQAFGSVNPPFAGARLPGADKMPAYVLGAPVGTRH
jgi:hypothetical protein